jgi:3-hydroxyacyl-CoA dehydrogenase
MAVPPGCIITSKSSSIIPSELNPSEQRKDKFVGLHFFYPVALRDIAEIIVTPDTSEETLHRVVFFLNSIRRRFLVLKEKESFILNRIFLAFQLEAFRLVNEKKASIHQIDKLVKEHFFPTGVFEFFDSVGLDVMLESVKNYSRTDPEPENYHPLIAHLQSLVSSGRLGTKTKCGFYGDDISPDPGFPENDRIIIARLKKSWEEAFRNFSHLSGIPTDKLKTAMDEYFGADTPSIC